MSADKTLKPHLRRSGVNATIILISCACVEGFLMEAIQTMAESRIIPKVSIYSKLGKRLYVDDKHITFNDFDSLFKLGFGKSLSRLVTDKYLMNGVRKLVQFRNGIAHGRSAVYFLYDDGQPNGRKYQLGKQYKAIREYLFESKLLTTDRFLETQKATGTESLFTDKIADHFAGLIEPFMRAVLNILPATQSKPLMQAVNTVFSNSKTIPKSPTVIRLTKNKAP